MTDRTYMCTGCRESIQAYDSVKYPHDGTVERLCPRCHTLLSPLLDGALTVATLTITKRVLLNGKPHLSLDTDDEVPVMEVLGMLEYAKVMAVEGGTA